MTPLLIIIALAPPISLVWFFQAKNPGPKDGLGWLVLTFSLGILSGGPALMLNHLVEKYTVLWAGAPNMEHRVLFWLLGIGMNEEVAKLLPLMALIFLRRSPATPYQGLMAGITVALGFSAVENLFYLDRYGTATLIIRSVLTVPAHAFFTAPLGYSLAMARLAKSGWSTYGWMMGGLLLAMAFHGLYDVWLSLDSDPMNRLAYVQVALMGLFALYLARRAARAPLPAEAA